MAHVPVPYQGNKETRTARVPREPMAGPAVHRPPSHLALQQTTLTPPRQRRNPCALLLLNPKINKPIKELIIKLPTPIPHILQQSATPHSNITDCYSPAAACTHSSPMICCPRSSSGTGLTSHRCSTAAGTASGYTLRPPPPP